LPSKVFMPFCKATAQAFMSYVVTSHHVIGLQSN
jgi:hypothetical protein